MNIKLVHQNRDGRYLVEAYHKGRRKRYSLGTSDSSEARRLLSAFENAALNDGLNPFQPDDVQELLHRLKYGDSISVPASTLKVSDAVDQFKAAKVNWKPTTRKNYGHMLGQFQRSLPKNLPLTGLTARHVRDYLTGFEGPSKATYYRHIKAFVCWCVAEKLIPDILERFEAPKNGRAIPDFMSDSDYRALLETVETAGQGWLADIIRVTCFTGLRRSEVIRLEVRDVDFQTGMIKVRSEGTDTTKSGHERSVPLVGDARLVLERLAEGKPAGRDKVFVWGNGHPITDAGKLSRIFKSYCRATGLDEKIKFHSMRDTCASWMVMRAVPLRVVQQVLGHSSITVTEKYAHLSGAFYKDAVVKAFEADSVKESAGNELQELKKQNQELKELLQQLIQKDSPSTNIRPGSLVDELMKKANRGE